MTIVEFLLARIAEDEAVARAAVSAELDTVPHEHIARWYPSRVLAECQAKRAIVELYDIQRSRRAAYRSPRSREIEDEQAALDRRMQEARTRPIEDAVRQLAAVYADHPDYDPAWRVA